MDGLPCGIVTLAPPSETLWLKLGLTWGVCASDRFGLKLTLVGVRHSALSTPALIDLNFAARPASTTTEEEDRRICRIWLCLDSRFWALTFAVLAAAIPPSLPRRF